MNDQSWRDQEEWLETDGLGGFASGTVGGIRTRRYHGILLSATNPPTGRVMLVNGFDAYVTTDAGTFPLSSQRYEGQVVSPEGHKLVEAFDTEPWPTWRYRLPDGTLIEHELFMRHGQPVTVMSWRIIGHAKTARLTVRPFTSVRDYHSLHQENASFQFDSDTSSGVVRWKPYRSQPGVAAYTNGAYQHEPHWYRRFFYQQEWLRGFPASEDLASPGVFSFDLNAGQASLVLAAEGSKPVEFRNRSAKPLLNELRAAEAKRRNAFRSPIRRAADQYIVRRGAGQTIIAGYPWFADWGRDTFISIRGLLIATGRLDEAREILLSWAGHVSQGMLPNRFPDQAEDPEYNSVDASLWYIIAVCEFLQGAAEAEAFVSHDQRERLLRTIELILRGYFAGTRYGIQVAEDGLLACGERGVQLTWMDAKVGDRVITPRIGKPVEVQALWLNAVWLASAHLPEWESIGERGARSFRKRFWNSAGGYLLDNVDVDHQPGATDSSFRPNQLFAIGGLPLMLIDNQQARQVVDAVEEQLLTPLGLRSLAPGERQYVQRYCGGPAERDAAYHQGTVWPWLMGAFVEAWVRVRGSTYHAKREAGARFVEPLLRHLEEGGLGHISEIADADAPHMPRGCPFQAWSLGELLRIDRFLNVEAASALRCETV